MSCHTSRKGIAPQRVMLQRLVMLLPRQCEAVPWRCGRVVDVVAERASERNENILSDPYHNGQGPVEGS